MKGGLPDHYVGLVVLGSYMCQVSTTGNCVSNLSKKQA
jgi:hypothetical protein